jgi:hypothetical protein
MEITSKPHPLQRVIGNYKQASSTAKGQWKLQARPTHCKGSMEITSKPNVWKLQANPMYGNYNAKPHPLQCMEITSKPRPLQRVNGNYKQAPPTAKGQWKLQANLLFVPILFTVCTARYH